MNDSNTPGVTPVTPPVTRPVTLSVTPSVTPPGVATGTPVTPPVTPPETPEQALVKLKAFNAGVLKRFSDVASIFEAHELDPTKTPAFKRFVADHLATANSWYVATGRFRDFTSTDNSEDPVGNMEERLREQGFVVSQSGKKVALDPLMAGNIAAVAAIQAGAFDDAAENEAEILGPEKKK